MDKEYRTFCCAILVWISLLFCVLALCACAKKPSPTSEINDGIQQNIGELVDYANNNMVMDADKQLLLQGAKDCAARANAMNRACQVEIANCESVQRALRAERNTVIIILLGLLGLLGARLLKRVIP